MADALGIQAQPTEEELITDFLGAKVPASFRGQPELPTAAPVIAQGTGPATGTAGTSASRASATETGSGGANRALQGLGLGEAGLRALERLLGQETPTRGPSGSLSDVVRSGVAGPTTQRPEQGFGSVGGDPMSPLPMVGGAPAPQLTYDPVTGTWTPAAATGAPAELGGVGEPVGLGTQGGEAATGGFESSDALASLGPYAQYLPYLAAAANISERAVGGQMPAGQQATYAALDVLGAALAPATFGLSIPLAGAIEFGLADAFAPSLSHAQREALDLSHTSDAFGNVIPEVRAAGNYDELALALNPLFKNRYSQQGYPLVDVPMRNYDLGAEGVRELPDREALARLFASDDPNAVSFSWQQGVDQGTVGQINQYLNTSVRQQIALIRAAEAGDPQAVALLEQNRQARDAPREAETARQRSNAGAFEQRAQDYLRNIG